MSEGAPESPENTASGRPKT